MAPAERRKAKEIFGEALRLASDERAAFVARACREDGALRAEVETLLAAHDRTGEFLNDPTIPAAGGTTTEGPGTRIDRYKVLQLIGEGGFGSVFMAEQEEPIRRRVALKIIKLGMDSRQVIARFEAERQALALMDHPNIARVFDAGTTATGRPYFVMELVRGVPITQYCDQANLSTAERLALFIPVCHALQHAHQKGIIHRDLKPSNVLVTLHDGKPVPKVIDFGIAKATDQRLTEKTLFTEFQQMIGTPAYMSPEQAEMSGLDIDTRSDVYSLGVLLYEILAGAPPFDPVRLRSAGLAEILRIIREEEPPKPSTRVSTLGEVLPSVAARRQTEPRKLGSVLRGDLDWVVMKALAKERNRRYDSATSLAADVERYLAHEPVTAGPPGVAYRSRKFVRRNRVGIGAGTLVALALVGAVVGTTVGLVRTRRAERLQRENAADAERKFQIAREGADLLVFSVARELPKIAGTRELERNLLDAALSHYDKLAAERRGDPNEERRIWIALQELGDAYQALGELEKARAAFDRFHAMVARAAAANPEDPWFQADLAVSFERLGGQALAVGHLQEAASFFEEERRIGATLLERDTDVVIPRRLLALSVQCLGDVARVRGDLVECIRRYRESLAMWESLRALRPNDPDFAAAAAHVLVNLSDLVTEPGLVERAVAIVERLPSVTATTPRRLYDSVIMRMQQALVASHVGDRKAATSSLLEALKSLDQLVTAEPRNPLFLWRRQMALSRLGRLALEDGDLDRARRAFEDTLDAAERLMEIDGALTAHVIAVGDACSNLADLATRTGDTRTARRWLEKMRDRYEKVLAIAPNNATWIEGVAKPTQQLANIALAAGDLAAAREILAKVATLDERLLAMDPNDPEFLDNHAVCLQALGEIAMRSGDWPLASEQLETSVAISERLMAGHPEIPRYARTLSITMRFLGDLAVRRSDLAGARAIFRRKLEIVGRVAAGTAGTREDRHEVAITHGRLGDAALGLGDVPEARAEFDQALELARRLGSEEPMNPRFAAAMGAYVGQIGEIALRSGDLLQAAEHYRETFGVQERLVAAHPDVAEYRGWLAWACEKLSEIQHLRNDDEQSRGWSERAIEARRFLAELPGADPATLNGYAWILVTCEPAALRDAKTAIRYARTAVERTNGSDPMFLDTLALALFESGDPAAAAECQEKALALLGTGEPVRRRAFESRLEKYRAGSLTEAR